MAERAYTYTPTEFRLKQMLDDGRRHSTDEIRTCFNDELCLPQTIATHIGKLRRKLWLIGRDIIIQRENGVSYYRQVMLPNPDDKFD